MYIYIYIERERERERVYMAGRGDQRGALPGRRRPGRPRRPRRR